MSKLTIFDENPWFLIVFMGFRDESGRAGGRRFDIRNLHVRIHLPVSRLFPDLLRARVAGGSRSAILVAILEFLKSRKTSIQSQFGRFGSIQRVTGPPLSGRLMGVVGWVL